MAAVLESIARKHSPMAARSSSGKRSRGEAASVISGIAGSLKDSYA